MVAIEPVRRAAIFHQTGRRAGQQDRRPCAREGLILLSHGTYYNVIRFLMPVTIPDAQLEGLAIRPSVRRTRCFTGKAIPPRAARPRGFLFRGFTEREAFFLPGFSAKRPTNGFPLLPILGAWRLNPPAFSGRPVRGD